jgi:hypothetical protein
MTYDGVPTSSVSIMEFGDEVSNEERWPTFGGDAVPA